ncbi:glycoside hydrolase family 3 protein [Corynebacterium sp. 153RC1]|uniref:glycoside hydrolase family 3 N-terminal domain-containing protein n=1 Tax=unclassified Corynebacterium TaxID=2624378 RepID=UPI00211CBF83|nr:MULTISPECIES: glycoside hydrolase family 3 N-terminal domain-containing protein [unclassified Corynebacterium]MCQ9352661.1 glycoside hydrolase family 3 protein [Corynebacterium sp. 209RC1]MCQ9354845.1 glycoside hydrolase family 3 protein [Corynebacterium sp. 1222RC1]MCQ9357030.1 glycoside hydrolase family 3 protein [Corynebacterium sp. 122RC1]MCQ9359276.1 glycoside hydrolase family 3 protein [Corynebacterium sp. 142RC1]MCQ9361498.1 glycoside hydrolase family 3 protein [Corynebacterium sp. 1
MKHGVAAILVAVIGTSAACAQPTPEQGGAHAAEAGTGTSEVAGSASASLSSAPSSAVPEPEPVDIRATAASLMVVGVADYADALFALRQGVGGIFIRSDSNPELLTQIPALRAEVGREFAVAIDYEGGRVQRHSHILGPIPSPRDMAATMSPEQVQGLAYDTGKRLAAHGITINFAPVVDVDGANLDVVGDRAFSDDPEIAARYAKAFAQGMVDAGVQPVFKHFPGHGRANGDSHTGEVVTPPLSELENLDLRPYTKDLFIPGSGVMMGHMVVPGLGDPTPSTLNPVAYQLLREGKGFGGVVYTDDLSGMRAISDILPVEQAVVASLRAGADRALWVSTQDLVPAIDAVVRSVESGEYPLEQLVASAKRK